MSGKKRQEIKRAVVSRIKNQRLYDPNVFLSPQRIDIAAKTIFARAYLEKNPSDWPEQVYKEHIRAFNNFYEKFPLKNNYDDFKNSFISTIESIKGDHNWKHNAPVYRSNNYLVNGAHRVAASIVLNDKVNTEIPKEIYLDNYNHDFFKQAKDGMPGIEESILDYITIEYVSLKKKDVFVAIIFPTAEGFREQAYDHLLQLGEIVNMKTFRHDEFVGKEVIKQLYFNSKNDEWNYGLDFDSASYKAGLCFDGVGDLQVYIIEANLDESTRIKEKQYLRSLWNKDKHSIHITDTIEEANRVVRMFFNDNSRKILKIDRKQEFSSQKMYDMFNEYISLAPKDIFEREMVAIEGSAVLDLLNIRSGKDIDYISRDENIVFPSSNIEKHDSEENSYHSQVIDEILTNPKYYFYYKGYKFIDILEIQKYKKNRLKNNDQKDKDDVELITAFLGKNPQYGLDDGAAKGQSLVSVIIPVYNTKIEYLSQSLDDVRKQNYKNLEIIVVDDGSTDETSRFIDEYVSDLSKHDTRWKVIHQKNKGLAEARNTGYRIATGKYVQFLDSDDYFSEFLIEEAVKSAEATYADITLENFRIKDYATNEETVVLRKDLFPPKSSFALDDIPEDKFETVPYNVWSKLFRKEFLDEHGIIHDSELMRAEDVLYSCSALVKARRISFVAEPYITYRENLPTSNTKSNDKFPSMSVKSWNKLYDFLNKNDKYEIYRNDFESAMLSSLHWHFERLHTKQGKKELAVAAKAFFDKINIRAVHDFRVVAELVSEDSNALTVFESKMDEVRRLNESIHTSQNRLHTLESMLAQAEQPSIKLATRKLAGAVKRKLRRIFSR